jgi:hypothetical protein
LPRSSWQGRAAALLKLASARPEERGAIEQAGGAGADQGRNDEQQGESAD